MADISLTDFANELDVSKQKVRYHLKKDEKNEFSYKGETQVFITEKGQDYLREKLSGIEVKTNMEKSEKKSSTQNMADGKIMKEIEVIKEEMIQLREHFQSLIERADKREARLQKEIDEWKEKFNDSKVENIELERVNEEWVQEYEKLEKEVQALRGKGFFKKRSK